MAEGFPFDGAAQSDKMGGTYFSHVSCINIVICTISILIQNFKLQQNDFVARGWLFQAIVVFHMKNYVKNLDGLLLLGCVAANCRNHDSYHARAVNLLWNFSSYYSFSSNHQRKSGW